MRSCWTGLCGAAAGLVATFLPVLAAQAESTSSQVIDLGEPFSGEGVDFSKPFTVTTRSDAESVTAVFIRMHWGPWGTGMREKQTSCEGLRLTLEDHFSITRLRDNAFGQVPLHDLVDETPMALGQGGEPTPPVTCTLCTQPDYRRFEDKPVFVSGQGVADPGNPGVLTVPVHAPDFFRPGADYCLILVEQNITHDVDLAVRKQLEATFIGYADCESKERTRENSGLEAGRVSSPEACRSVHLGQLFKTVRVADAQPGEAERVEALIFDTLFKPSLMTTRNAIADLAATWPDALPRRRDVLWSQWTATGDFHRKTPACPLCELTAVALVGNGILDRECKETRQTSVCRYAGPSKRTVTEVVPLFDPLNDGVQGFDILLEADGNPRTPDSVKLEATAEELKLPGTSITLADVYARYATDFVTRAEGFLDGTLSADLVPNTFDRFIARLPLASPRDPVVRLLAALELDNRSLALGELAAELLAVRGHLERAGRRVYRAIDSQRRVASIGVVVATGSRGGGIVLWLEPDGDPTTSDRSELDVQPGALTLPGSDVSLEDLLQLVAGKIRVAAIDPESWQPIEDLMDEETPLGRPFYPVWKATAPRDLRPQREAVLDRWEALVAVLDKASAAVRRKGLNDLDAYKLVGRWLNPLLEGPDGSSRGSLLEHGMKLLENMRSYHRMAEPWDTRYEELGVRLSLEDISTRAAVMDAQAALTQTSFFDQFVTPSLGYEQITFPDGTVDGTVALKLNVYAYPNAVDEPMWSNGFKADLRRLFSLQVGLLGTGGLVQDAAETESTPGIGPGGRYEGVISGLPPLSFGIGAQVLPYVTLSAGGVWMAEHTTTLQGERPRPVVCAGRGVFLEINAFSYFRKLYQGNE